MDKGDLAKRACYLIDTIEDALAAVEANKPAESLPLYHYKSEEYTPAEDTFAIVKKAFGKLKFLELAFNTMEKYYQLRDYMGNAKFELYGRGTDWFQHNNYDLMLYDLPDTFVGLYSIAKAELHASKAK
jgi:hypothetical protein